MSSSFTLDDAITLARTAHAGQTDKASRLYIEHPLRGMRRLDDEHEQMAAVLHDVLEDTADIADPERLALLDPATAQRLRRKHSDSIQLLDHPTAPVPGTNDGH